MAVVESRLRTVETEQQRARERLHELETDRATIRLLAKRVDDLADSVNQIAESAAERAVSKMVAARDRTRLTRYGVAAALLSSGAGVGTLIAALALR